MLHTSNQALLGVLLVIENPVCNCNGHNAVIGICHAPILDFYVGRFMWIELIDTTNDVTNDSTHQQRIVFRFWLSLGSPVFSLNIGIVNTAIPSTEGVWSLSPSPMTKTVIENCLHGNWHSIVSIEVTKSFTDIGKSFIQKIIRLIKVESYPALFVHMSNMCATVIRHILPIVEAMSQVRCYDDVVKLLREEYVIDRHRLCKQRCDFLVLKTCNAAAYSGYKEFQACVGFCKLNELIHVWLDGLDTSLHSRYGIRLARQSNANAPFRAKLLVCCSRCTAYMLASKIASKDEYLIFFKYINSV